MFQLMYKLFFRTIYYCSQPPNEMSKTQIQKYAKDGCNLTFLHPNGPTPKGAHKMVWAEMNYLCIDAVRNYHNDSTTHGYLFIGHDVLFQPRVCKSSLLIYFLIKRVLKHGERE